MSAPTVLASDNNFGTEANNAYGQALDSWATKLPAEMQQNKGAGTTLEKVKELKDDDGNVVDNLVGPPLVVEIEKSVTDMAQSPGTGQFTLTNGAAGQVMRALSKSEVYFSRPKGDSGLPWFDRSDGKTELGSLYSPYWEARLAPNNFLEQYISMETQMIGL
jgi:hypothetical protein